MLFRKSMLLSILLMVALLFVSSFSAMAQNGEVEIFSWWTGGGEEEGLNALIELFNENYPNVEVINATVAGGAGSNAKAVLKTRMVGGNPPDSFQVHGGAELVNTYVETGLMEPITGLLEEWGVKDKFNQQILEMSSYEGEYYSVPVNVHRSNIMFYNKAVLEENNVEPPTDLASFKEALAKLDEAGVVPLSLGDTNKWPATQIFESLLVSTLGPDGYNGLWNGNTAADDPAVREALVHFNDIMQYVNEDHSALTWQDATQIMHEGEAGFNIMGDWAEGYMKTLGWTPGEEFGWMPVPESEGTFIVITDTFGLPKGAPNPENAKKWLKTIASVEGQDTFNPIKGSIPARLDADKSKYDPYLTSAMEDFAEDTLSPSIAHGSAAPEGFITALNDTINEFITTGDVDEAFENFQKNHEEYVQ
ncbi:carbohydrate ABC transporter substrate-binding protein, CUT1 family [Halanaerobium congolense]|jgi:glucose/mannose transport system substrate-binding protein|uniref:Probable sugar-binding periplasmic protein n=1 Tax=Halanaerobium congolense TaxID=54121 RepID=A0A1G6LCM2_9FIRM|nr:ABC transporter substrate-binding protein [Halanaerobium congolense]PUU89919.1 MAG: multiple sugar transport system substrate-binding protein [Halanaerobium sp.]PTX15740.1 carbohydrate ABC transporter substrate-binding protein (CUT1 family) [Halanaerobium congolense]TDP18316.1 carbohydrate ABC transporter substrate-binding protein (CUT1 family) [Halanaerobium congolense]TDX39372.1 carbohydrate ABC transporter substrate-binding protein (CUT1 family) [Halanaerobium congolense]SDC40984.1 carbo